ncbi:hypothetical protein [Nocardioides psychrotolerans]|uniref:hypothetical protein n=1 Tax=Nocardioides psychrotolerans TaxID=1005945 RepID=UPI003138397F
MGVGVAVGEGLADGARASSYGGSGEVHATAETSAAQVTSAALRLRPGAISRP